MPQGIDAAIGYYPIKISPKKIVKYYDNVEAIIDLMKTARKLAGKTSLSVLDVVMPSGNSVRLTERVQPFVIYPCKCAICGDVPNLVLEYWNIDRPTNKKHFRLIFYKQITAYNGKSLVYKEFNSDHIIPESAGGVNHIFNRQLTCQFCNLKKGTKYNDANLVDRYRIADIKDQLMQRFSDTENFKHYYDSYVREYLQTVLEECDISQAFLNQGEAEEYTKFVFDSFGLVVDLTSLKTYKFIS